MSLPSPEVIAYHEAGHAVAAIWQGMTVTEVSIVPSGTFGGYCQYALPRVDRVAQIESEIRVGLAGPHAEEIHFGRFNRVGADYDWQSIDALVGELFGAGVHRGVANGFLCWLNGQVVAFVETELFWGHIEVLASALLAKPVLTQREVYAAVCNRAAN